MFVDLAKNLDWQCVQVWRSHVVQCVSMRDVAVMMSVFLVGSDATSLELVLLV